MVKREDLYHLLRQSIAHAEAYRAVFVGFLERGQQHATEIEIASALWRDQIEKLDVILLSCHELIGQLDTMTEEV